MKKKIAIFLLIAAAAIGILTAGWLVFFRVADSEGFDIQGEIDYQKYHAQGFTREQIDKIFANLRENDQKLKENPNNFILWAKQGTLLKIVKEYQLALENYQNSLKINPAYAPVYAEVAELYVYPFNNFELAEKYYKLAIEKAPFRSDYYRWLADLYISEFPEKKSQIEPMMAAVAEDYPDNPAFYSYLANFFLKEGNNEKALKYIKKCLEIKPDDPTFQSLLEELESKRE